MVTLIICGTAVLGVSFVAFMVWDLYDFATDPIQQIDYALGCDIQFGRLTPDEADDILKDAFENPDRYTTT